MIVHLKLEIVLKYLSDNRTLNGTSKVTLSPTGSLKLGFRYHFSKINTDSIVGPDISIESRLFKFVIFYNKSATCF
jgi:hypothetical protein